MKGKSEEHIAVIIRIIRSLIFFSVLVLSGNFNKLKIYLYLKLVIHIFFFYFSVAENVKFQSVQNLYFNFNDMS